MRVSRANITRPKGGEETARAFDPGLPGLREIPKPDPLRARGGASFDTDGIEIHLSVEEPGPHAAVAQRHFGIECADVDALRATPTAAGVETDDGRPAPWKRFFVRDPFGNRIEIHEPGGRRA